jgi:predicted RNA-binding Zn ribbon-like protein
VREAVYRIFARVAHGEEPLKGDLAILNDRLSAALGHMQLQSSNKAFLLRWDPDQSDLESLEWPKSSADLLADGPLDRVKQCANDLEGCG